MRALGAAAINPEARDNEVFGKNGGGGTFDLLGGTGMYAGISGNCPYDTEYLPDNHLVATGDCTWKT